jgi:hypothetical protein
MTKWSETRDFTLLDFVKTIHSYGIGRDKFDAILVNTAPIPQEMIPLYLQKDKSTPIVFDPSAEEGLREYTQDIIADNFLSSMSLRQKLVRHDPTKLAREIIEL